MKIENSLSAPFHMLLYNLTTNNFNKQKLQTERKYKTKNVYTAQAIFAFHFQALFQH